MNLLRVGCRTALCAVLASLPVACQIQPPEGPAVLRERALAAEQAGEFARAGDLFLQLIAVEPDRPEWVAGAGRCLGRAGRLNDAIDLLDSKRKRFPGALDLPALLARTLLLKAEAEPVSTTPSGNLEHAIAITAEVLALNPDHLEGMLIMAQARYQQGDVKAATAAAEAASKRHPDHAGAHILLGRIHADRYRQILQQDGAEADRKQLVAELDAARACLQRAIALDANRTLPHVMLGRLAAQDRDTKQALDHYAAALLIDPDAAVDHAFIEENAAAEREAFYQGVLDRYGKRPLPDQRKAATLHFYIGRALYERGELVRALAEFETVQQHNPAHSNAAYYTAMIAMRQGDHDKAERNAARYAQASAPGFADLLRKLVPAQRDEVASSLRFLADRAWRNGRVDHSRDLNHVLACLLDTTDAWNNWALLCRETKRYDDSLLGYKRALEKEPDSPQLLNDMAVILHFHLPNPDNLKTARAMYQRAIAEADKLLADPKVDAAIKQRSTQAKQDAQLNLKELGKE